MNNNKKIIFIVIVVIVLIAAVASAFVLFGGSMTTSKQPAQKMYKVGVLSGFAYIAAITDGLKAGMADLGYVEGKNIIYDVREVNPDPEGYRVALQGFADDKVDLMVTFPTEASLEGKKIDAATGIPLVFVHANFEDMDLIGSIKEPGNNLTGVRYPGPDVALKRLEILMKILPDTKDILIPYHKDYPNVPPQLDILHEWSSKFGVNIIEMPVGSTEDLEERLTTYLKLGKKVDVVMTLSEIVSANPDYAAVWGKILDEYDVPAGGALLLKDYGYQYETLFGVDANAFNEGKQASKLVDKVLKGADAGKIPVESAEMYFQLNYRLAIEMGVEMDDALLGLADEIIR